VDVRICDIVTLIAKIVPERTSNNSNIIDDDVGGISNRQRDRSGEGGRGSSSDTSYLNNTVR